MHFSCYVGVSEMNGDTVISWKILDLSLSHTPTQPLRLMMDISRLSLNAQKPLYVLFISESYFDSVNIRSVNECLNLQRIWIGITI